MALKSKYGIFDMNTHGVIENPEGRAKSNLVQKIITDDHAPLENFDSRVVYQDISVDRITPRSINQYKQNRIDRLAKSIRNTNNRLIHPIVLVKAADLPRGHEVLRKFEEQGVDVSKLEYIIVAGERRYRAWLKLRAEQAEKDADKIGVVNPFDTITANVLTHEEAYNESAYFEDSNLEARQLTPLEGILHIKSALEEVQTPEQKREALIEMNGSEEGIPEDPDRAARSFNAAKYCLYYLSAELGIEGWSLSTVKAYMAVVNKCPDEVIDAVIDGSYKASMARDATDLSAEQQLELLQIFKSGEVAAYREKLAEYKADKGAKKPVRMTYRDAKRQIGSVIKSVSRERSELKNIADKLGPDDKAKAMKAVKKMDAFMKEMEKILDTFS